VRQLVELHGGSVRATSGGKGCGSRLTVEFPLGQPSIGRERRSDRRDATRQNRIVIVDDNADAREMLRILLGLAGHEVYEADDGPRGVEMIQATSPEVALVDVGLPGFDGYEVARRIRSASNGGDIFMVALTGYAQPEDRAQALRAGFDMHLVKPIDRNDLVAVLSAAELRRKAAGRPGG